MAPGSLAHLTGDEPSYVWVAVKLIATHHFVDAQRPPLYPVWLAVTLKVAGNWLFRQHVLVLQALLGATAVPLTYALGRQLSGMYAGLLAALGVAVSFTLVNESAFFQSEVLYTPFVVIVAILLVHAHQHPSPVFYALAGIAIGVSDLIHATLLPLPLLLLPLPLLLLVPLATAPGLARGDRVKLGASLVAGVAVVVLPWMAYVDVHFGRFAISSSNAILWLGSPAYEHDVARLGYLGVFDHILTNSAAARAHPFWTLAGDSWWTRQGEISIEHHFPAYLWYSLRKSLYVWTGDPYVDWGGRHIFDLNALHAVTGSWIATIRVTLERLLIFPTLVSAFILRKRWRDFLPVYAIVLCVSIVCGLTAAAARLGESFYPLLLVVCACGVVAAVRSISGRVPVGMGGAPRASVRFAPVGLASPEDLVLRTSATAMNTPTLLR